MQKKVKKVKNIPKPTHFGKNLKFLRRLKGMSQTEVAKRLKLTRSNIASYESGMVEPNMEKFLLACTYFSVRPKEMLESVLSESPVDVIPATTTTEKEADKYYVDHMEEFISQTNEMTKILEGYKTLFEMRKGTQTYQDNKELYNTLDDLFDLLRSLIVSNWNFIQSFQPDLEEE